MNTNRFRPLVLAALFLLAAGVAQEEAAVAVSAVVPLAYLLYAEVTGERDVDVEVARTVEAEAGAPGSMVEVSLEVENPRDSRMADVRVVDSVPPSLHVVEGDTGVSGSLDPGESMKTTYTVLLRRGEHGFGEPEVHGRNVSGSRDTTASVDETSTLICRYPLDSAPEPRDALLAGSVTSDEPGEGVEFHSVRDYRRGDPLSRVDWRRFAKTGDLSTVEFHEEMSLDAVVVLDGRTPCFQAATEIHPDAVEYGVYAVERLYAAVSATGGKAAVSVYSLAGSLPPTTEIPASQVSDVLESRVADLRDDVYTWVGGDVDYATEEYVQAVDEELYDRMQVFIVSPLIDEASSEVVRGFSACGRDVTVVSPDVTWGDDPAPYIEGFHRRRRIRGLRSVADVVDWDVRRSLDEAVQEAGRP